METLVLERYVLNAEAAFERNEYLEGIGLLEEALAIEPNYSKAHNHLGWAYLFQLNNLEVAEKHLQFALNVTPVYGPAYIHMSHILFNKGKYNELTELLETALSHGGVQRSFVYNEFGRMSETNRHLRKAIGYYKKAVSYSMDEQEMKTITDNIHRCRHKRWILMF